MLRVNLLVPDLQVKCSDLIRMIGYQIVVSTMATRWHVPLLYRLYFLINVWKLRTMCYILIFIGDYNENRWDWKCCRLINFTIKNDGNMLIWSNSSSVSNFMWGQRYWSTVFQIMAWCLMAPSHYLNQCWLLIIDICDNANSQNQAKLWFESIFKDFYAAPRCSELSESMSCLLLTCDIGSQGISRHRIDMRTVLMIIILWALKISTMSS